MQPHISDPFAALDALVREEPFITPCGKNCIIREIGGAVEAALVKVKPEELSDTYLKAVIKEFDGKPISQEILDNLKARTRVFIVLKARILSYGNELSFEHYFGEDKKPTAMEEDLNIFITDFSKPVEPEYIEDQVMGLIENPKFNPQGCKPYPANNYEEPYIYMETSSGKKLRYQYKSNKGEKLSLKWTQKEIHEEFFMRFFEFQDLTGHWHLIPSFEKFSGRDLAEMRGSIKVNDPDFEPIMELENPKTKQKEYLPVLAKTKDFFYPTAV